MIHRLRLLATLLLLLTIASGVMADNLYRVSIASETDAEVLRQSGVPAVHRLMDGYLVIADDPDAQTLTFHGLKVELLAPDILAEELFIDASHRTKQDVPFEVVYEAGSERIFRANPGQLTNQQRSELMPLDRVIATIVYNPKTRLNYGALGTGADLFDLIDLVDIDSLRSYVDSLVAYDRLTGTASSWECSAWLKAKFESFGYDSVRFEEFEGRQFEILDYSPWMIKHPCDSRNVIAVKPGLKYPEYQIVIGAHMDHMPDVPGADDNGSGTAGVLELARILADIETDITIVFCAFDSEESGVWGSYDYVDRAVARNDDIWHMLNLDMIGYINNWNNVLLYHGPQTGYSELFSHLADSLLGLSAILQGESSASDHLPFHEAGIPTTFVIESSFNEYYHTAEDDVSHLSFDYIAKNVKASLATVYTISNSAPSITTLAVYDVGDGLSFQAHWRPENPATVDRYEVTAVDQTTLEQKTIVAPPGDSSITFTGMITDRDYLVHVILIDTAGAASLGYNDISVTPRFLPPPPQNQTAEMIPQGIHISWASNNTELDFDHFALFRDGALLVEISSDTSYYDLDPGLGTDIHDYLVAAVDTDDNMSDTTGATWINMKAASLSPNHILAINRTGTPQYVCDSTETRIFLQAALSGLDYEYSADPTLFMTPATTDLNTVVDYEVIVIGAESGKGMDDLSGPLGLYPMLGNYLNLGGKVVIFGRWGDVSSAVGSYSEITYNSYNSPPSNIASQYLHLSGRTLPLTVLGYTSPLSLKTDLIGGHSLTPDYPNLAWDSVNTATQGRFFPFKAVEGIPCPSIPHLDEEAVDILYTYDSKLDSSLTEGAPVAWRYLGEDHQYVCFDLPLSFMDRDFASYALRQALMDLGIEMADDHDNDGVSNNVDNCRFVANADQTDTDNDGFGDACDLCESYDDLVDSDADYVPDGCDQCEGFADLVDHDRDAVADGCDICAGHDDSDDLDSDGVPTGCDNCPETSNPDQADADQDNIGDLCDGCCGEFTGGYTGNADCDTEGKRNLADITRLIDRVYISKAELCCEENGNVDGDAEFKINLADITALIDHVYISKAPTKNCL